ncbi:hypothetical protein C4D60_Mb06t24490 [Musa balbisiana]|uniref:Uncharacterized protein n=1 Tax=Musa balbisiana TaxID=52838 RepID=A0A4S8ISW2_MUSBA|nr:hypothetical protein C4D60_Mb06t24490 [Musa balbisiana]
MCELFVSKNAFFKHLFDYQIQKKDKKTKVHGDAYHRAGWVLPMKENKEKSYRARNHGGKLGSHLLSFDM